MKQHEASARGSLPARIVLGLVVAAATAASSAAAEFKVLAPNAAKEAVSAALALMESATPCRASVSWTGTEAITRRVSDGEVVDVVVNAAQNIDRQAREGKLIEPTRTDFARSSIGVAVPASSARPDVSTPEALKSALLAARTVVVSSGTSGRHMVEVFGKLGVGDALRAKTKQPPSGAQIADFLAAGEAELGFQQVSELLHAKGVHYLGPIPAELQSYTVYSAALHAGAGNTDCGKELLSALRSGTVQSVVRSTGMEPL